jgi:hypothetical protein
MGVSALEHQAGEGPPVVVRQIEVAVLEQVQPEPDTAGRVVVEDEFVQAPQVLALRREIRPIGDAPDQLGQRVTGRQLGEDRGRLLVDTLDVPPVDLRDPIFPTPHVPLLIMPSRFESHQSSLRSATSRLKPL